MIGDAEILEAELLRGGRHFLEGIAAVTRGRVAMKSAAQIFRFEQARQASRGRRLEFAAVFAQLRRDVIQTERAIEIGSRRESSESFELAAMPRFGVRRSVRRRSGAAVAEAIFVQRPAALQRATPDDDVVLLAPGKIIQRKRIFRRAHHPQIALNAGTQSHARLRRALRDDRFDERMLNETSRKSPPALEVATMKSRSRTISFRRR